MRADDGDLAGLTNRSWSLLFASNTPPWLYRCGGGPSWIERDNDGRPVPRPMTEDRLRHVLAQLVNWRKRAPNGDLVPAYPPPVLLKNVLATPDPALPVLAGIVTAPVFGTDSTLITEPGYHPATRLLYEPAQNFALPPVPERPTRTDRGRALAAARRPARRLPVRRRRRAGTCAALLLLPFVRPMISGPTPLHMVEKPAPGTGATLMVDAISIVTTGTSASVMVEGRDEDEWRKRLTAKLREIPSILLIDNLRRQLDASSVAAALTAPYWEDRVLGKSEMVRFPIRCVWIATGNNPQFSNEIARRMVRIRLDPHEDQPWLREGFRHPNLLAWVWQYRARLVAAASRSAAPGSPPAGRGIRRPSAASRAGRQVMGGILEVAGVPGFLGNLKDMYERADAEGAHGAVRRAMVGALRHGRGGRRGSFRARAAERTAARSWRRACQEDQSRPGAGRMRDRIFTVGDLRLRVLPPAASGAPSAGSSSSAKMALEEVHKVHTRVNLRACGGGGSHEVHTEIHEQNQSVCEPDDLVNLFHPYACARTHVR